MSGIASQLSRQGRPAGVVCRCVMCGDSVSYEPAGKMAFPTHLSPISKVVACAARGTTEQTSTQKGSGRNSIVVSRNRRRIVCYVNRSTPWRSLTRVTYRVWSMHIDHRPKVNRPIPRRAGRVAGFPDVLSRCSYRARSKPRFPRGARTTNARAWRWHGCCSDLIPSVQNSHRLPNVSAVIEATPSL